MKFTIVAAAFIATTLMANQGFAESRSGTVRSGVKTPIYSYAIFNRSNCGAGAPPRVTLPKSANGTYSSNRYSFRISKGRCKGKVAKGVRVFFRSKRGFRGTERSGIGITAARYVDGTGSLYRRINMTIRVK